MMARSSTCRFLSGEQRWVWSKCTLLSWHEQQWSCVHLQDRIHKHRFRRWCGMHRYEWSLCSVQSGHSLTKSMLFCYSRLTDSCKVTNGGCDVNAICTHDLTSNGVVCTCKTGFTNTGSATNVTCTGEISILIAECCRTTLTVVSVLLDTCLVSNGGCDSNAVCSPRCVDERPLSVTARPDMWTLLTVQASSVQVIRSSPTRGWRP